ncbi:uncharacterized protein LOC131027791 [Cryptomeria japonica]|uniref:uncharacterized protein LOC131027791 n=1 Tax=Cryptomeria japonica TaxID=3369 RepID=UPI0027DA8287|nr:uncharacterized protein LOC131027791 [Cryptomeria japonica]
MSSLPSSSSSSDTPAELINKILNTQVNKRAFDLRVFVKQIDDLIHHYEAQLGKKNPIREQLGDLPSEASNFVDQVSTNVTRIANEIKEYSGNKHETSIKVLNAIGSVHWVAVGFLVVGAALKIADTIKYNVEECLRLLKSMSDLSKIILQLHELPDVQKNLHDKLKKSIEMIVEGAISCCSQKKRKGFKRVWKAARDRRELQQLRSDMDDMRNWLHLQISVMIDDKLTSLVRPLPLVSIPNHDAVGIEDKIEEVIQRLDWESNSAARAVVVYGIGGSGKTTLANAVYSSLPGKLQDWKCSKITLIRYLEKDPNVEDLQSLILEDLTGTKHNLRDFQSGQQILKEIIEKGPVFIYIDNVLYIEPLKNLLPKDVSSAKKLRLLITARDKSVSGVIECCGIESCEPYDIGSLSIDAALKVLCKNIDRNREMEFILQERPQVRQIADKCSCCPLFLELIGCYLHQRKNEVEPYEQVLHSIEDGGFFSGSQMYNFDEQRVLFTYDRLNPSAKEAFLDICSYFSSWVWVWEWEKVEQIVGWEEMQCLEGGALIKREGEEIKIHDLILTAGRNKSKDNRFNDAKAFSVALKNKERVSQIKGIWIESMKSPLLISAEELDAMSRSLRVLRMGNEAAKMITIKGKCGEQFDELRFLHVESEMCNLLVNMFNLNQLRYLSIGNPKEDVILSRSMNLPNLNVLKFRGGRIHGIAEIGRLCSLKQLTLDGCQADWISLCFTNLHHLQRLKLSSCRDLTELPESLVRLQFLQKLDLSCCNLKQLPAGFGELTTLTELDLSGSSSLQELPRDLENLTALTSLTIYGCSSLTCLPHNLGGLMSALGSDVNFHSCSSLSELPEDIYKNEMVRRISLEGCTKLERLPRRFGELTCLQKLNLYGCESLQELCNDFHYLGGLTELKLNNCKSLSSLPLGFGNLTSLETLNLSGCDKLDELPIDFHCLVALKRLDLSECNSLFHLPDHFGDLGCLEWLSLSGCSKLVKLSDDFHLLRSLIRLDLSNCGSLAGEWMDKVGNIKSLWRLDIVGSERMIERWMETKSQKERNLTVVTAVPQGEEGERALLLDMVLSKGEEGERALLLDMVLSKVFDEEGLLVDADERPFHSSSLQPQTPLIFIIDEEYHPSQKWEALGKNLQQLQSISKELQIIYIGSHFKSISSELAIPILAYTPDDNSFYHKLSALFDISDIAVFRSTDELEENGLRCLSAWEDISSYMCNRVNFLTKTPLESNIELLNELLVTNETDYLLLSKNRQVKVAALQGKMILLLYTNLEETQVLRTSVVKEMYLEMQDSHNYEAELVWVPHIYQEWNSWEEFERVTANAPWPVVPNPWLIDRYKMRPSISGGHQKLPRVCVVDKKGRISKDNALPMIERWGLEAYPFSQDREEELAKAEWEAFKFDSLSNLQFVFPNLEFSNKAKEMMDRLVMMLKLAPGLNCALTMLEMDFLVFYVARRDICAKENEDDVPCTEDFFYDMYEFWLCVRSFLLKDLNGMGGNERIVKLRRMVLGLASEQRESWYRPKGEWEMRVVLVDGNGEMLSRRGMEVVELPCGDEKDSKENLVEDIKTGDVEESEESMWRDGIMHPKHYCCEPLLKLRNSDNGISCSLCGEERNTVYECTVRGKHVICEEC